MSDEVARLVDGSVFNGRFQIVRRLKAGGMGAVYEVVQLETLRRRAWKVMLREIAADAGLRERFKREATVAAEVESEHIVEVLDAGIDAETNTPFLLMELLKGEDLGFMLDAGQRFTRAEAITLLDQV